MRVLERGIQPAFSGKCSVQVNQVSITETTLDEARGVQQIGASAGASGRRTDCERAQTALERDGDAWSLADRTWSLRDQHAQIAETFNMQNMKGTE